MKSFILRNTSARYQSPEEDSLKISGRSSFEITGYSNRDEKLYGIDVMDRNKIAFRGPSAHQVMFQWNSPPKRILLLSKLDPDIFPSVQEAISYLRDLGLEVLLEEVTYHHIRTFLDADNERKRKSKIDSPPVSIFHKKEIESIDLVIAFGGDGLLMHCNTIFEGNSIPPTMCFDFGSLGFLAPFSYSDFKKEVETL
jgi:hypothetical protein